jgi:hypothetical protein
VSTTLITANASSAVTEAGMSHPTAQPAPAGDPLANVSTNPLGKTGGFPDAAGGPGTGRQPKTVAGKTVARPRTPFNLAIYGKKS